MLGQGAHEPAARRRGRPRARRPRPRRRGDGAAGAARRRRRRPRLARRRAGRRHRKGPPPRPLRLRRLLRRPAGCSRRRQLDLDARPALGRGLPDRQRPHLLRGDADQGPAARVPPRPRGGADLLHRRHPRGAADRRLATGRRRARQDRDAEPGARPGRPGARPGRRRGAGGRPALRRRLRLGAAVGRVAGRQRRRRPCAATSRCRAASTATGAATARNCAGTPS